MSITLTSLEKASESSFGATPHSIILTGEKSFKEEEFIQH
jgi:diphthamide biosynthesis methyltransferase